MLPERSQSTCILPTGVRVLFRVGAAVETVAELGDRLLVSIASLAWCCYQQARRTRPGTALCSRLARVLRRSTLAFSHGNSPHGPDHVASDCAREVGTTLPHFRVVVLVLEPRTVCLVQYVVCVCSSHYTFLSARRHPANTQVPCGFLPPIIER